MSLYHALEKSGYAAPAQNNPYAAISPSQGVNWSAMPGVQAPKSTGGSWLQRNIIDNPWIEGATSLATMLPVFGGAINGAWQGTRAAYHAAQGNYGKAGEAAAWGAAGFIPGGAIARGAKLGIGGAKALRAGSTFGKGVQAVRAAAPVARTPGFMGAAGAAGKQLGGGALDMAAATGVGAAIPNYGPGSEYAANAANAARPAATDLSSYGSNLLSQGIDANRAHPR